METNSVSSVSTFYRGITSYWRRRKYQRLDGGKPAGRRAGKATLGPAGRGGRRFWRTRPKLRFRIKIPSLAKLFARFRDAYVDWMLSLAGKGSGLAAAGGGPDWSRRIPTSRPVRPKKTGPDQFEQRLIFEIYKSLVVAGEIKQE